MKKLFIGKLSPSTTESTLRALFASYEPLSSVKVITDKMTGAPRGFAFIELDENEKANEAIKVLNGAMLDGQMIVVNEARPQENSRNSGRRSDYGNSQGSSRNNYRSSNSSSRY